MTMYCIRYNKYTERLVTVGYEILRSDDEIFILDVNGTNCTMNRKEAEKLQYDDKTGLFSMYSLVPKADLVLDAIIDYYQKEIYKSSVHIMQCNEAISRLRDKIKEVQI